MTRTTSKVAPTASRVLRKSAAVASLCAVMLVANILNPTYAYGDSLSDAQKALTAAQNELTAAQKELTAAQSELTKANNTLTAANNALNAVASSNATINAVNNATAITNDVVFSGQKPLYVPVNGNTGKPASSTLVGVEGMYVNGTSDSTPRTQQQILDYINQVRKDAYNTTLANGERVVSSYKAIAWSKNLERTAQVRAAEISIYGDHTRPSGESWYGVNDEGLMQGYAENLSWGANYYNNIKMWVDEKADYVKYLNCSKGMTIVNGVNQCSYGIYGHYKNLVNPQYTAIGIAQFNTDRSTVNPYNTAMAAEFNYNTTGSQSSDVKAVNTAIYQGVYVKSSAMGSVGTAGATTFSPSKVSGDPVWTRNAQVKEAKALAKSMASTELSRLQSNADYKAKQAAVTAAQKQVDTAQNKVNAAQTKVNNAQTKVNNAKKKVLAAGGTVVEETQDMYRLYSRLTGEHLYTSDSHERDVLKASGIWIYEGVAWVAPTRSNTPVYRLYSPPLGDHHYTSDPKEVKALTQIGWKNEGIAWYSDDLQRYPIYRQFSPRVSIGSHNYTGDLNEYKINNSNGWQAEGIAWYGIKAK